MLLFFDTETTGLPDWGIPSEDPSQPHIVEIAAMLTDMDGGQVSSFCSLIRPTGWTIESGEAQDVHGITTEMCEEGGVPFNVVWPMFKALMRQAELIVAHNLTFDKRMLRIALKRMGLPEDMDELKVHHGACTMNLARSRHGKSYAKLQNIYTLLFGKPPEQSHRAGADVLHCRDVYLEMKGET